MKKLIMLAFLLTGMVPAVCAESGSGAIVDIPGQPVSYTRTVDVSDFDQFSIQVDYEDVRPATSTIANGSPSSVTLTVADYAGLNGVAASATITLEDGKNTSAIDGAVIRIKGHPFTEGVDWDRLTFSTQTMADLDSAIEAFSSEYSASVSSNVVTVTAGEIGTYANSWAITSSTGVLSLSGATFSGGQAAGYFSINGVTLTEGTDWDAETSSATTAGNIAAAINANSTLSALVSASTTSLGVVTITSLTNGVFQYPVSVSDTTDLTPSAPYMASGAASDISVANDTFYEPSHGYYDGLSVLLSTVSNSTPPTGLTRETTYYAIRVDNDYYQLASSANNAIAGTEIDITAIGTSGTLDIKPLAFVAGSAGFDFRGSNDGSTFYDLTGDSIGGVTISSVTYSADGGDVWNFTNYPYRYIRFNFVGPTSGAVDIDATMHWRR